MKAIILVGGSGTRLRPFTEDNPKAMVRINGKPLAAYQMDWLLTTPTIDKIVFACGHKWERLQEFFGSEYKGVPIKYGVEVIPLGTGGAIKSAIDLVNANTETVLVCNGDVITNVVIEDMLQAHKASKAIATILVVPYRSKFGIDKNDKLKTIRKFEEKPEFIDTWINGGIYIIDMNRMLRFLPKVGDIERTAFPNVAEFGEMVAYPYYGKWWYVDSMKDVNEVESEISTPQ
jgi:NDP-sugar pyrophosphorylase family protein